MKKKNNLDEMQEQKLLKIEHTCCWIAFWGLVASILIQILCNHGQIQYMAGELAVLFVLGSYMSAACIKNGIWDRVLKPTWKTNLTLSLVTGTVMGLVWFINSYYRYHKLLGSLATFAFMFGFTSLLCYAALSVYTQLYKKRRAELEAENDRGE